MFRRLINRIIDLILYGGYKVKGNGVDQICIGNYKIRISLMSVGSGSETLRVFYIDIYEYIDAIIINWITGYSYYVIDGVNGTHWKFLYSQIEEYIKKNGLRNYMKLSEKLRGKDIYLYSGDEKLLFLLLEGGTNV